MLNNVRQTSTGRYEAYLSAEDSPTGRDWYLGSFKTQQKAKLTVAYHTYKAQLHNVTANLEATEQLLLACGDEEIKIDYVE